MATVTETIKSTSTIEDELKQRRKRSRAEGETATEVPVISLSNFLEGSAAGKKAVAEQWDRACSEVGFVTITDHGVPPEVIHEMWKQTTSFFDRPLNDKRAVPMSDDYPYGYQGMGMENLEASLDGEKSKPGDIKEMFNMCLGTGQANDPELPTPRWPEDSPEFCAAWSAYYDALAALASNLYRVCALALGLPEDWFASKISRHRNALRAINYPVQRTPPLPGQLRASVHTDYGALTILRLGGEHSGGLQVMGSAGEWVDIDTKGADAFVINLGDLMARWTNDRWLSTPHRVINPNDAEAAKARRQSVAYFCNINMDASVECIPTCAGDAGAKYEPIVAGDHLMKKHSAVVAGKLCYDAKDS
jgi:isopenicillin N synthase-like dioxygenase